MKQLIAENGGDAESLDSRSHYKDRYALEGQQVDLDTRSHYRQGFEKQPAAIIPVKCGHPPASTQG